MVMGQENVLPALVMVWVVPPENCKVFAMDMVTPEPFIQLPYTVCVAPLVNVIAKVRADASKFGT